MVSDLRFSQGVAGVWANAKAAKPHRLADSRITNVEVLMVLSPSEGRQWILCHGCRSSGFAHLLDAGILLPDVLAFARYRSRRCNHLVVTAIATCIVSLSSVNVI